MKIFNAVYILLAFIALMGCSPSGPSDVSYRHGETGNWKAHAFIWDSDSMNTPGFEAVVTIANGYISAIESWDRRQKTRMSSFRPAKLYWSNMDPDKATFKTQYGRLYTLKLIAEVKENGE